MTVQENVQLDAYTTLKIGGAARYFAVVATTDDFLQALKVAEEKKLAVMVLGGGSNVLFDDRGFDGFVIKNEIMGISWGKEEEGEVRVHVGAGESWDAFVAASVLRGLYGLENLSGIPGTVGASPVQNIGAYGVEVQHVIESVQAIDTRTKELQTLSREACLFGYRDSIFKRPEGNHLAIVGVTFILHSTGSLFDEYKDVVAYKKSVGKETLTLSELRAAILHIRSLKFPPLARYGTAGSFFKNPIISSAHFQKLSATFPGLPGFAVQGGVKVPLAWVLDTILHKRGWKKGKVACYEKQPLVLVTEAGATAEEVKTFAHEVAEDVERATGIRIEWEVRLVPRQP